MSPLKQSERRELFKSLQKLSAFFDGQGLHFEGQSREKGFDVSEFAGKKIISHFISTVGIKLLPAEKQAIFEVFLGKRDLASIQSLRLTNAFNRVCFEIARHDQFLAEQNLCKQPVKLNNVLKNRLAGLWMKMAEIYKPKPRKVGFDRRKSLERTEIEQNHIDAWVKVRTLETLAETFRNKPGMKNTARYFRHEANRIKKIIAESRIRPILSDMRDLKRRLTPRIRRGRR